MPRGPRSRHTQVPLQPLQECRNGLATCEQLSSSAQIQDRTAHPEAHYFSVVNVLSTIERLPSRETIPTATLYCLPRARKPSGRAKAVNEAGNPVAAKSRFNSGWSTFTI